MRHVGTKSLPSGPQQLTARVAYGALRVVDAPRARTEAGARAGGLLGNVRAVLLPTPNATLGRSLENSVVVLDPAASRRHASLKLTASGWLVENVSPRNPLWVDGRELGPGERLALLPGTVLRLGNTSLQLLAPLAHPAGRGPSARAADDGESGEDVALDASHDDDRDEHADAILGLPGVSSLSSPWLMGKTSTRLLSPGVTLQYALKGRLPPRVEWVLALVTLVLFIVSAVLTLGVTTLVGQNAAASGGVGHVLAALTIPLIPALGVTAVVLGLDRYEREPPLMLLAAFLWGAVIAIPPVLAVERGLGALAVGAIPSGGVGAALARAFAQACSAGVTEELVKGAGLVLLLFLLRDEFDNVTDGALYGALIGAGFGMVENFVYFALTPRADLGVLIFGRVVLGWLSHSTFTALFGVALGYLREKRGKQYGLLLPVAGLLAAIALHTLFDFVALGADVVAGLRTVTALGAIFVLGVLAAEYLPLFGAQVYLFRVVVRALGREAETVRSYLAPEVLSGVVTPEEYVLAQTATLRNEVEREYLIYYGPRAYLTARGLFQAATGLAFRKWHVAQGDPPKPTPQQPEDAYRARIARLRRSLRRQVAEHQSAALIAAARAASPTRPLE